MTDNPARSAFLRRLEALVDRLIPATIESQNGRNSLRIAITAQLLVFLIHVVLSTLGELGLMSGGLPLTERVGLGAIIAAPTVVLWTTYSRKATEWSTIAVGWTIVLWASLRNGGVVAPQIGYVVLLPVLTVSLFGDRQLRSALGFAVSALTIAFVYSMQLDTAGALPKAEPLRSYLTALVLTFLFSAVYMMALRQLKSALAALRQETAEARSARAAAEEADQARRHFVAVTSHELRTPLTGVLGSLELLERTLTTAEQRGHVEVAKHSAATLRTLIEDILAVSQLQAGKVAIRPDVFRLDHLLERLDQQFQPHAERGSNRLIVINEVQQRTWYGDPVRLFQVLSNLTSNALKFCAEGEVRVEVRSVDDGLEAIVSDTGVGMPPEMVDALFEPFVQGTTASFTGEPGTGLGLGITKNLVELMDGSLSVSTALGEGTQMTIRLPFVASATQQPTPVPLRRSRALGHTHQILVVDDNPINTLILKQMLETLGAQVEVLHSGLQAIERAGEVEFSCILMDVHMPELDGLAATRQLRASGMGVPIIGVTASPTEDQVRAAEEAGMDAVLGKPTSLEELDALLAKLEGLRQTG